MRLPNNRDPKPVGESWWLDAKPEGFTEKAAELFSKRHEPISMAGITMGAAEKNGVV